MAKATTPDYEAIGKAVVLLAGLFNSGTTAPLAAAPAATTSGGASKPAEQSAPSAEPEAPKDEGSMSKEAFSKQGMDWAKAMGDNGAKAKALFASFGGEHGYEIKKFSDVKPEHYDAFIAAQDEAALA